MLKAADWKGVKEPSTSMSLFDVSGAEVRCATESHSKLLAEARIGKKVYLDRHRLRNSVPMHHYWARRVNIRSDTSVESMLSGRSEEYSAVPQSLTWDVDCLGRSRSRAHTHVTLQVPAGTVARRRAEIQRIFALPYRGTYVGSTALGARRGASSRRTSATLSPNALSHHSNCAVSTTVAVTSNQPASLKTC